MNVPRNRRQRRIYTLLNSLIDDTSSHVMLDSTRAAIEKMAEDFAREALADPVFREEMKRDVKTAIREVAAQLRENRARRESGAADRRR